MAIQVELSLRGPNSYGIARQAIATMESQQVWPTPLNFELWVHYVSDPSSPLGQEIDRLVKTGNPITEAIAESLAAQFLPKARLNDEIRDAGDLLSRQLTSITDAIQTAQHSTAAYGQTLAGASAELDQLPDAQALRGMLQDLAGATRRVQEENSTLEHRLRASTEEIVRLREHLEQVRLESMTDALTTLANRKAFDEGLEQACLQAAKTSEPLTLAVLDIDHFKHFNDTWGHQTGDQVIRYVASVIGRLGELPRIAARYGGEEFAVIFPASRMKHVTDELESVRREIGSRALKRRSTNEDLGSVTVSVGVAEYVKGEPAVSFLERADAALYASKRAGRDRVTLSQPEQLLDGKAA